MKRFEISSSRFDPSEVYLDSSNLTQELRLDFRYKHCTEDLIQRVATINLPKR